MKKVLFITYYFPPSGGSGVQRVVKFVKYLPQFGWKPLVYTVEKGEYPILDESLLKDLPQNTEILRYKIWEPYSLYKKFTGQSAGTKISPGFLAEEKKLKPAHRISRWIRGNLFIPDARKYWIKPSVSFLKRYLHINHVDAIISSGPPHSVHLIALSLKKLFNIPWIADFRDPWTDVYYFKQLHLSKYAEKKHSELEYMVLNKADCLIAVGNTMKNDFEQKTDIPVEVITNGFDEDDIKDAPVNLDEKFSIVYTGYLLPDENPEILWQVLSESVNNFKGFAQDLELKFAGKTDVKVIDRINHYGLDKYLTLIPYQPHNIITSYQQKAQVLLLLLNDTPEFKRVLTGKLFEYLAARRPIISIGSASGDAAEVIRETGTGYIFSGTDKEKLREKLMDFYNNYKHKNLTVSGTNLEKYSRRFLTQKLAEILNNLLYVKK